MVEIKEEDIQPRSYNDVVYLLIKVYTERKTNTKNNTIEANQLKQQILQNQKLRELVEKIDIDITIQQIAEWAFLQGEDLTTEKRRQLGDIKDILLKIQQLLEESKK